MNAVSPYVVPLPLKDVKRRMNRTIIRLDDRGKAEPFHAAEERYITQDPIRLVQGSSSPRVIDEALLTECYPGEVLDDCIRDNGCEEPFLDGDFGRSDTVRDIAPLLFETFDCANATRHLRGA